MESAAGPGPGSLRTQQQQQQCCCGMRGSVPSGGHARRGRQSSCQLIHWPQRKGGCVGSHGGRDRSRGRLLCTNSVAVQIMGEVVRRGAMNLTASGLAAGASSTYGSQYLPPNALVVYGILGTLAASIGAWVVHLAKVAWEGFEEIAARDASGEAEEDFWLYGVNVTGSRFLTQPAVLRAAAFAAEAHKGQTRMTGEPYITHCVETAGIVEGLLNAEEDDDRAQAAVIAALLHDVVDDTAVELGEVEERFGAGVAGMVSKVTQLSQVNQLMRRRLRQAASHSGTQNMGLSKAEEDELRAMILTMVDEPLVIVVKLADRLHNMRTVYALQPPKQRAVALETLKVWCSLAERLGMFALKSELEDLTFAVLQPTEYRALRSELDQLWGLQSIPNLTPDFGDDLTSYASPDPKAGASTTPAPTRSVSSPPAAAAASKASFSAASSAAAAADLGFRVSADAVKALSKTISNRRGRNERNATVGASVKHRSSRAAARSGGHAVEAALRAVKEDGSFLTPEQRKVKVLIASVLPFDALMFKGHHNIPPSARRGLEVLENCARLLLNELRLESYAPGLEVHVEGRLKSLYSMYRKMTRKGVSLREIYDARALRVVVDDDGGRQSDAAVAACYKLLPAAHRLWRPISGECDDYIVEPKGSGYQSLHTAVTGPGGVPLEVQIRTSMMHEAAEYGRAAHWAYKEAGPPKAPRPPAAAPAVPSVWVGQPALRVREGRLQDGVIVTCERGGCALLVATAVGAPPRADAAGRAAPETYRRLMEYVERKGWWAPGHGDLQACLEEYTLCTDGRYHRLDPFGHKLQTIVVPLPVQKNDAAAVSSHSIAGRFDIGSDSRAAAPSSPGGGSRGAEAGLSGRRAADDRALINKTRLLRSVLEWGREVEGEFGEQGGVSAGGGSGGELQSADVMVLLWPPGEVRRLPRGTTAGAIIRNHGSISIAEGRQAARGSSGVVNVNNRLVPEETELLDGDMVVLSRDILRI